MHLHGTPQEMGRAHGALLKSQISSLIQDYIINGILKEYGVPFSMVAIMARRYEAGIPAECRTEMQALAEGAGVSYDEVLVGNLIVDLADVVLSLAPMGSSGFVAGGAATSGEAVVHGANIEWKDYNNALQKNLVIIYYEPDQGNKFVSLSYAGGIGVLIGMNKHLSASISVVNAGVSTEAIPTTLNLRRLLQSSNNLADASANLIADNRTRGYNVPLAGSQEGFFITELSPMHYKLRQPAATWEALVGTNHFVSEAMQPYQLATADANSVHRYDRLIDLIAQNYGLIDGSLAKTFMSDRNDPYGDYINSDSVVYSAVLLPEESAFWVAKGPVGNVADYVRFNLED